MSESNKKGSTGRFQSAASVLPPFKVDTSSWHSVLESSSASTGRLVGASTVLPPVDGNVQLAPEVFLELTLRLSVDTVDWKLFISVGQVIDSLDTREKSLGGQGIAWERDRSKGERGCLTLVLSARNGFGAQERFVELVKHVAATVNSTVAVAEVHAKVCRAGSNGQSEVVCEVFHSNAA